jgi:hypothetical protein
LLGLSSISLLFACSSQNTDAEGSTASTSQADLGPPHAIQPYKELVIVHPTVVADPFRTSNAFDGPWSFRWLMEQLSGDRGIDAATDFVTSWLSTFHPQNAPDAPPGALSDRPGVDDLLARWPHQADGRIDLTQAPLHLLAITNRIDLGTTPGDFGEGRFVFGLVDPTSGQQLPFAVIFEFRLPPLPGGRHTWAEIWHILGDFQFGDPIYNEILEIITRGFATYGGGRSLHQLRTNEIAFAENPMVSGRPGPKDVWELREWHLERDEGGPFRLHAANVKNTPDGSFNGDAGLAQFILDNASAIADGSIDLAQTGGARFLGFESHEQFARTRWDFSQSTPSVPEPLRSQFAMLTCNGCHNAEQLTLPPLVNGVGFYQVSPLVPPSGATDDTAGQERLSPFITQIDINRRIQFMQAQLADPNDFTWATNLNR